jgi:hypothetical protein
MSEEQTLREAYKIRDISTRQLPAEFRFITYDTRLQEVIDKVGPCSRIRKFPVDPSDVGGYGFY